MGVINYVGMTGTSEPPSPTGTLTPATSTDFAVIVTNNGSLIPAAGWSDHSFGDVWTKQLSSNAPVSFADLGIFSDGLGTWANVLASFSTTGTVAVLQTISFGSGGY